MWARRQSQPTPPASYTPTHLPAQELAPLLPGVATQVLPELSRRLAGRITARLIRELFV